MTNLGLIIQPGFIIFFMVEQMINNKKGIRIKCPKQPKVKISSLFQLPKQTLKKNLLTFVKEIIIQTIEKEIFNQSGTVTFS
jgi:hypothetical protein